MLVTWLVSQASNPAFPVSCVQFVNMYAMLVHRDKFKGSVALITKLLHLCFLNYQKNHYHLKMKSKKKKCRK